MDIDELLKLCVTYVDPEYIAAKIHKTATSVLKVNISDTTVFGTDRCSITKLVGENLRYYLEITESGATLEVTDIKQKHHKILTLPDTYDLNTLRIFHLKRRMSFIVKKMHETECVLDKIAAANTEIRRSIAEISSRR